MASYYLVSHPLFHGNERDYSISQESTEKQGHERACAAGNSVVGLAAGVFDCLASLPLICCNVLTGGKIKGLRHAASQVAFSGQVSLPLAFKHALRMLNPDATFNHYINIYNYDLVKELPLDLVGAYTEGDGLIPEYTTRRLRHLVRELNNSPTLFHRQITARMISALGLLICPITRSLDLCVAFIATPAALLKKGKVIPLNNIAYRALQFPGILWDANYFLLHLINPSGR